MNRKLLLPVRVSLRIIIIELRLARMAAELALDVTRAMAERAPGGGGGGEDGPMTASAPPVPEPSATPPGRDPAEPARAARRRSATQRTRAARPPAPDDGDRPAAAPAAPRPAA